MISIIIPTYNRRKELACCLDSILEQAYDDLEIIVVDDCSSDNTISLKENYSKWPQLVWIRNEINKGVNFSRNRAIEAASKEYILFIDSDDLLAENSLQKVVETIEANKQIKHFLFLVSDRATEFESLHQPKQVDYSHWLSGSVNGDFTHVIRTSLMKQFPFFEQFRMYEHLNWLRVKKTSGPQLMVPIIVANRERDRADSLTNSMKLQDLSVIQSKFESESLYYSMYYSDLKQYNPNSLGSQLVQAVALATACNQKQKGKSLLQYAGNWYVKMLSGLILYFPSSLVKYGIIKYSVHKSKKLATRALVNVGV
jgi:glycosyltransferase involved in cell wall biosynthesis